MKYILMIVIYAWSDVEIHSVEYESKTACNKAGEIIVKDVLNKEIANKVSWSCSPKFITDKE